MSVRLWTKWLWVRIPLQSLKLQILRLFWARSSLTFRQLWSVDSLWNAYVTWEEHTVTANIVTWSKINGTSTAWKVSKYRVIPGPYFPLFGLNTEIYEVNLRIQSRYRKIQTIETILRIEAILRIHHQLYYFLRFNTKEIYVINMKKFEYSVERQNGTVTPAWFKYIFFQSLIPFFTKFSLRFNHLIPFLISRILKQTSSFSPQVCLSIYDFLLPPDVFLRPVHFNHRCY